MRTRSTTHLVLPSLLLGLFALIAVPTHATDLVRVRTVSLAPAPPRVLFSTNPHWVAVPGTRVYRVRDDDRPSYDMMRYGSRYYIYDQGYWYRSTRWNGPFVTIQERSVPTVFYDVPSDHWRRYPPGWSNPKNPHSTGRHDNGKSKGKGHGNH